MVGLSWRSIRNRNKQRGVKKCSVLPALAYLHLSGLLRPEHPAEPTDTRCSSTDSCRACRQHRSLH